MTEETEAYMTEEGALVLRTTLSMEDQQRMREWSRLVEAAPALLAAAEAVILWDDGHPSTIYSGSDAFDALRTAVAAARGEAQESP